MVKLVIKDDLLNLQYTLDSLARGHDGRGEEAGKTSSNGELDDGLFACKKS